jgi:hypothetical protein
MPVARGSNPAKPLPAGGPILSLEERKTRLIADRIPRDPGVGLRHVNFNTR